MICVYQFDAVCACPVDGKPDVYGVTVRSLRTIPVETILSVTAELCKQQQFQEQFTESLHRALAAQVETVGFHSGIKTTVTCG